MTSKKTPYEIAKEYVAKGWAPIPIPFRKKSTTAAGWSSLRLTNHDQLITHFGESKSNIGVLLGEPSSNLVDIDLDVHEALPFAKAFLPPTAMFGRNGNPDSHWLYICEIETKKFQYRKKGDTDQTMLVEIRSTGAQTVFPGSTHESGETIQWSNSVEPVTIETETLYSQVSWVAAGALLSCEWPKKAGSRNAMYMAMIGGLMYCGWTEPSATLFINALCTATKDEELADRLKIIKATFAKAAADKKFTGWKTLTEFLDESTVKKVREWLDLNLIVDSEFRTTDLGNAKRFEKLFKNRLIFNCTRGKWYEWVGHHWKQDEKNAVRLYTEEVIQQIKDESGDSSNTKLKKLLKAHVDQLESRAKIDNMLNLAQDRLAVLASDLDKNPWLMGCANGTIDLKKGELRDSEQSDLITRTASVKFDAKAKAPRWLKFLEEIFLGKKDVIHFVHKSLGYTLTGLTSEQVLFLLWGTGWNGKSTFLEAIRYIVNDYSISIASASLMESKSAGNNASGDIARLQGVRFATTTESKQSGNVDEERIKLLVSSDAITARFLYQEEFEFKPEFKLWVGCNHRPNIKGTDTGIWRRIRLVPFTAKFPPEKRERGLEERLKGESEGILAWMVAGCLLWQKEGLIPPEEVTKATEEYRNEMDTIGSFLSSKCLVGESHKCHPAQFYAEYKSWSEGSGEWAVSLQKLLSKLRDRGIYEVKNRSGSMIHGVGVRTRSHKKEEI